MKFLIALIVLVPLSISAQDFGQLSLQAYQIEALESKDGTYARFLDLSEGFVSLKGVTTQNDSLLINLNNSDIDTIILQDGSRLGQDFINQSAVLRGGDMGGGGSAFIAN